MSYFPIGSELIEDIYGFLRVFKGGRVSFDAVLFMGLFVDDRDNVWIGSYLDIGSEKPVVLVITINISIEYPPMSLISKQIRGWVSYHYIFLKKIKIFPYFEIYVRLGFKIGEPARYMAGK